MKKLIILAMLILDVSSLSAKNFKLDLPIYWNDWMATFIQIIVGVIVFVGIYIAFRIAKAMEQTAVASIKQTEVLRTQIEVQRTQNEIQRKQNEEQNKANRRSLTLDQYIKSIDQLGNRESIAIRLGAIYSLERIMNSKNEEDEKYHNPIIELLASYVREKCHFDNEKYKIDKKLLKEEPEAHKNILDRYKVDVKTDIQAIITVLGRREKKENEILIDFSNSNLYKYVLKEAHLEKAFLQGAHLENADLFGALLENAILFKTHLEKAFLQGAHLEYVNLHEAHLENAILFEANLENAYLYRANLENAILFRANLENADLENADLEGANLENADLYKANLENAYLSGANLKNIKTNKLLSNETKESRTAFIKELDKAKKVKGIQLDKEIMDIIRKDFTDLLKRIETGEGEEDIEDS